MHDVGGDKAAQSDRLRVAVDSQRSCVGGFWRGSKGVGSRLGDRSLRCRFWNFADRFIVQTENACLQEPNDRH